MSRLIRKRLSLPVAAALLAIGFLACASPAHADYTLTLTVSDNLGNNNTGQANTVLTLPDGGAGSQTWTPAAGTFTQYTGLSITFSSSETPGASAIATVDIAAGTAPGTNLSVKLDGEGFIEPVGPVTGSSTLSSSAAPTSYSNAMMMTTVGGLAWSPNPVTLTPPATSATSTASGSLSGTYAAIEAITINGLQASAATGLFVLDSNTKWQAVPVPVPPGLTMALLGAGTLLG